MEVLDGSGDRRGGQGGVGENSGKFGTGWGSLPEFLDWSLDCRKGLGQVSGPTRRFWIS